MNLTIEVALVPPGVATLTSYIPAATPAGITAPDMVVFVITAPKNAIEVFAGSDNLTELIVELAVPPKKPVPVIVTVVSERLLPVFTVTFVTVGAGTPEVITSYAPISGAEELNPSLNPGITTPLFTRPLEAEIRKSFPALFIKPGLEASACCS